MTRPAEAIIEDLEELKDRIDHIADHLRAGEYRAAGLELIMDASARVMLLGDEALRLLREQSSTN